jgi:manganese-dependent inorganic pyrophosphatase
MAAPVYVIGHVNPDTDSIAAALGYAWLLRERDKMDAIAARAGAINMQTGWVLKILNLEAPVLLTDASPRFESVTHRLDTTSPDKPLRDAWSICSRTVGIAPLVNPDGTPYGLVTGESLFAYLNKLVGPHPKLSNMKISQMLDAPSKDAADVNIPKFHASVRIRDLLNKILRGEGDNYLVIDESGRYIGICRQRDLLNPPRLRLVLVDHNEAQQAVASLDEAELVEILDHHRLGNASTHTPIRFTVDIVGSTSTLISEQIEEAGLSAPPALAGIMLAGLLSDTLCLTSPTTTERDRLASERLGRWAIVAGTPLADETVLSFGQKILAAGAGLDAKKPSEVVQSDMKIYNGGGYQFSISQAEVSDLYEMDEHITHLVQALSDLRANKGLDFAMLMVTDVVKGDSRLLLDSQPPVLEDLPYPLMTDGTLFAEGVVSRKKQLLPVVLGLLEV